MIRDFLVLGFRNLRRRRLRSWLTMVGIFIAIATIFTLISVSLGLESAVKEQFRLLGTDKFTVLPNLQAGFGESNPVKLTSDDVDAISRVNGVKYLTYFVMGNGKVEFRSKVRYFMILGMQTDTIDVIKLIYESSMLKIDEGKFLEKGDRGVLMLGSDFKAGNIFPVPVKIGNQIKINDIPFKVKGILQPVGNPQDDKQIYLPLEDFKEIFNSSNRADTIFIQIQEGADIKEVAGRVEKKLRDFRGQTEKTQDFAVLTPEEYLSTLSNILNIITAFLLGIAAISLVVGGIGIANTMYTSVIERIKEIGIMKAIGAKNSDILLIFLIESGLLGLVGGIIGVAIGIAASKTIEYIAFTQLHTTLLKASLSPLLIIGCLAFAFLAGAISGTLPAWRASQIKPVQALRYE